ncbi:MAG: 16S rRNA (cytidine(1402)-2'-O)-methyltransferase [Microcoleaceae cyanobacterium]
MTPPNAGTLYIVGTPIGNLDDITFRAIQTLKQVDLIAAEDTRHTGKLLHHFQIDTPQMSYHTHNHRQRVTDFVERLQQGQSIALVTDAGLPGVSDPGNELVRACIASEIPVSPIPGVSASLTALCAAGLATDRFIFEGFLPVKGKERRQRLAVLTQQSCTMILYEAPHRLCQTLKDLIAVLGPEHSVVIARELTKLHEEFWRSSLEAALTEFSRRQPKGEITLVLAGVESVMPEWSEERIRTELQELIHQGLSRSQASRQLAQQTTQSRQEIYQIALTLTDDVT